MGRKKKRKMNKKVYILMGGCIDDKHVIAVFSSMKQAQNAILHICATDHYYKRNPKDLDIEQHELNTLPEYY